ncbi:MAG TPA: PEGA domain-containing protein [Thermotogota bacterium]|nr:PEGA domain-containing protein [Thermotogota bacterium]HPR94904.1 PEGA domain-containing protein [Thermotogota bacterium]
MKKLIITLLLVFTTCLVFSANELQPRKIIITPEEPSTLEAQISINKGEGAAYQSGESISISFRVNKDSYVVIYDTEANGDTHIIFPNRYQKDNFVRANQMITVPQGYKFTVGGVQGKEYLQIVASTAQFAQYNAWSQNFTADPFPSVTANAEQDLQVYARKIIVSPDDPAPEWTSASTYFYVGNRPLDGTVSFNSVPSGAAIWVDGAWLSGTTPLKTTLSEGYHYFKFSKSGYQIYENQFYLSSGGYQQINASLVPLIQQYGQVTINSQPPNSSVYLDGTFKGNTPITISNISTGMHKIEVRQTGYNSANEQFQLNAGEHKVLNINLTPEISVGTVNINTYPVNAKVSVDGTYYTNNNGQVQIQLNTGMHTLTVSASGYNTKTVQFSLNAGEFKQINAQLEQILAEVRILSNPSSAKVYINNNYVDMTGKTYNLVPGYYEIKITKTGYQDWSTFTTLVSGQNSDIVANLVSLKGIVKIRPNDSCTVYIDGNLVQELNAGSLYNFEIESGIHEFVFLKPGYYMFSERINVTPAASYNIYPNFQLIN